MRKGDDGEKRENEYFLVATTVIASRPPNGDRLQRRQVDLSCSDHIFR